MPRPVNWISKARSVFKGQQRRAQKYGVKLSYTANDLLKVRPEACPYCGVKLIPSNTNWDHIMPVSRGGKWTLDNMRACCAADNRRKCALEERYFVKLLRFLHEECDEFTARDVKMRLAAGGAWAGRRGFYSRFG